MDPRFEAAQRTNQSGSRGWDFDPVDHSVGFRPSFILVVIAAVVVAASLIGAVLS